jgi:signal transduction histidine kinase
MAVKGARDFIMQYPTSQQIQPVLDATRQVLRLQASSSLHQAIADSAVALFEAAGAALFLVDRDRAALTAVSGSWAGLDPGASHTTAAILEPEVPVLVVPIRDSRGVVVAALWIRTASSEVKAPDGGLALELFAVQTAAALENARAYERLIRVDSKRQDDIATLAHELRNPLGAIVNALAVLDRLGAPDARILQLRALIRRQTTHLAKLIEDVLDLARLRHGKLRLECQSIDLRDVVRLVVDTVRASGRAGDHDLRHDAGSEPLVVGGDSTRLEQVVRNLVDNALKYSPQGTVVAVSTTRDGTTAALRVRDEGIGMDAEMLSRAFEPFAQADAGGDRAAGGLGLGLPLVHAIVEQHGGTITVHSDGPGKGSEFVVRLPLR